MNMAGNLGGVVSTAIVPILVARFGWPFAFQSAAGLSLVADLLWVFIRMELGVSRQTKVGRDA